MVYLYLAQGFEEIEALTTVDFLRRCDIDVVTVGVGSQDITGAHDITVLADTIDIMADFNDDLQAVILPGGMPGTLNLKNNDFVIKMLKTAYEKEIVIGAICAAPSVLGSLGILDGKKATCFPGFENELGKAEFVNDFVVTDGNIVTAKGAGCTIDFAYAIAKSLSLGEKAQQVKKSIQCKV